MCKSRSLFEPQRSGYSPVEGPGKSGCRCLRAVGELVPRASWTGEGIKQDLAKSVL